MEEEAPTVGKVALPFITKMNSTLKVRPTDIKRYGTPCVYRTYTVHTAFLCSAVAHLRWQDVCFTSYAHPWPGGPGTVTSSKLHLPVAVLTKQLPIFGQSWRAISVELHKRCRGWENYKIDVRILLYPKSTSIESC